MEVTVESNPHLDRVLGPKKYHAGFSVMKLMAIIKSFSSDEWARKSLIKAGADDKVLLAFNSAIEELIKAIEVVLHVNTKRPRERAREYKKLCNQEYWSVNGEGTRAKMIVERERKKDPFVSAIELGKVLTSERVLNFRGRTTLPINRTEADYKWSNQQIYHLLNIMNISITKRPSLSRKRRARSPI